MIRKATMSDLDEIMDVTKNIVKEMNSYNNYQWNNNYPKKEDFISDIAKESLFILEKNNELAGFTCINKIQPLEYNDLNWSLDTEAYVVHRLAVNSKYRKEGIAYKLLNLAEKLAIADKVKHLRTDTYSLNTKAQSLFEKFGYNFVDEINFCGNEKSFYCYEKLIF
ncbi:GNAT family N-acetyltransferase [Clostridium aestuarii]|uniref:GNAT family N-acetyltransferase n=1 Tax=Clostridium aestuarii TaxID=338193 RepID=A0ABT4D0S1_9CLOT|nr:GNAT family N-acetyltransferase [Clostridium aestuarii]MCY6484832.1 GNAT family N-acetyltransferase [Clostridium aestuarii]